MYLQEIPKDVKTTTPVQIKYDCCGKEHTLKHKDAKKNFDKNGGQHICRQCWLRDHNPAKRKDVQDKMKKTNLERYGATCAMNTPENTAARNEKLFQDENVKQQIVEKRKKTSQERFGTDHPMQSSEVKAKQQATLTEKYGVAAPLQNEEVKAKMRQTVQDRYGVTNVAKLPEVRAKMAKTMFDKHGVEHYNQLPEMKDYLREHCPEWLKESWDSGGPMKGITRPEEWNQKQRETVMKLMDEGKWNTGPKYSIKGKYNSSKCHRSKPMFRSSYELKVHWHLDQDANVEWYDYEPFRVAYTDAEGKRRYYVIDFIVKYKDNPRPVAIEVKNDYNKERFEESGKVEAFQTECGGVLDFAIWCNDDIAALDLDLEELLESLLVEEL